MQLSYTVKPLEDICHLTTATETVSDLALFSIFPNPARHSIQVQFSEQLRKQSYSLCIVNLSGSTIFRKRLAGRASFEIDTSTLVPGIYLLEVTGNDGQVMHEKLIKL